MTREELFRWVDYEGACAANPDCECIVYYNTAIPQFPDGLACVLVTPRARLRTANGEGRIQTIHQHGGVMRVCRSDETARMFPRRFRAA